MSNVVRSRIRLIGLVTVLAMAGGCAQKTPPPPVSSGRPLVMDLDLAVKQVAADLSKQLGAAQDRTLTLDPLLDRTTGQQTAASRRAQALLAPALTDAMPGATVQSMDQLPAESTGLVVTGSIGLAQPGSEQYVLTVALTDRSTGVVVAQAAGRFTESAMDGTPTAFYSDSPSLVRDRSVEGYLKTAETPKGTLADPLYVEQLPTSALIASAIAEYEAGRWEPALAGYTAAAARPDGQTLRTFNGLYLTNVHLGRMADAEAAFGKIVALGLSTNNLAVKLLFRPGTTDFISDASVNQVYPVWLRQIARGASASRACLRIVGHTSASGTPAVNDPLSLARAEAVRARLLREVPALDTRLQVKGVGSRENIVGTGADDASDAVDRRVEFDIEACAQ